MQRMKLKIVTRSFTHKAITKQKCLLINRFHVKIPEWFFFHVQVKMISLVIRITENVNILSKY